MTVSHFLLMEDDDLVGELLEFILQREGYEVTWARNGHEAMKAIHDEIPFKGAILDIMVPHVDGHKLLQRLREHPLYRAIPVLMLTARADSNDLTRALDAGADDYLVKPFQPAELTARLKRMMR